MGFFQFGRKFEAAKEYSLEEIPVFSALTPAEQRIVEKLARLVEYKRGDIVYEEGKEAEAFYVVVSGRFRLFNRSSSDHPEHSLIFFYRGDHFGEASLLTGNVHSGTVEAKSDGLILRLEKEDFFKLVKDIPSISLHLNRVLGHRLTMSQGGKGPRREVKISAFFATSEDSSAVSLWVDFASAVKRESHGDVILLDFSGKDLDPGRLMGNSQTFAIPEKEPSREADVRSCTTEHRNGFHYMTVSIDESESSPEKKVATLLTFLTYRYDHLLVRLPGDTAHTAFQALKQSDGIYIYCAAGMRSLASCRGLLEEFEKRFGFSHNEMRVLVPEENVKEKLSFEEMESLLGRRIFALLPEREEAEDRYQAALGFLARELTGTLIGLALGSGAAYGLAHIGVIKVLERENIPVDVVSGSSMGALVGALWAAGYNADELCQVAGRINKKSGFFRLLGLRDVSIAHQGFFKGQQLSRFLAPYLKDKTFQDLKKPLRIVATDMFTAEEVVFRAGLVTDAIRASVSIPGIFRPFLYRGKHLIDGGVIDPLPVRVLTQMGVKKVIAVNVLPSPKDWSERFELQAENQARRRKALQQQGAFSRMLGKWSEKLKNHYSGNIFNAIMNTIQFMEYEMAESGGRKADVLLHPTIHEAHWAQFYYPDKFIKAGEIVAEEQIDEIRRMVAE